ncbi:hypothetical protein BT63DRAFT_428848 [Microthyrium microscopicum]|uniref:Uncharacterized protein n=1 Tax=Microthyrium microscopicum TaxID=703497 RepID=A0A6A6TYW3_9PEZI|nr:hypothetical protein BT63DRAFT_428848 [Microthyrium microscopicum]
MKLSLLSLFSLAACTIATAIPANIESRQARRDPVQYNIDRVTAAVNNLNKVLAVGPGNDGSSATTYFQNSLNANKILIDELRAGTGEIKQVKGIYEAQALSIVLPVTSIVNSISTAATTWTKNKKAAVYVGAHNAVIDSITLLQAEAAGFVQAILDQENFFNSGVGSYTWVPSITTAYTTAIREYRKP